MLRFLIVISVAVVARGTTEMDGRFNRYLIYTRTNYNNSIELDLNVDSTIQALTLEKKTAIIIHGHQGSGNSSLNPSVKNAFLESEDIDVIIIDWSFYAGLSYSNALLAVPIVAESLANVISELVTKNVVTLETLHLVGFDLGAHVAGYTGRGLDGKVARITDKNLPPEQHGFINTYSDDLSRRFKCKKQALIVGSARSTFIEASSGVVQGSILGLSPSREQGGASFQRLRITDALYVEILHTDGVGLLAYGIGNPIGDVDFFINGGTNQPECSLNHWCSHNRSWKVFAVTLNNNKLGNQCNTWLQVILNICHGFTLKLGGNDLVKYGFGMFRVNTRE